jgi:hypothetical protein
MYGTKPNLPCSVCVAGKDGVSVAERGEIAKVAMSLNSKALTCCLSQRLLFSSMPCLRLQ